MGDPTVGALWPRRRGRFALSRWRRPLIRSLPQSSAIASHMSPSRHCSTNPLDGRQHRKKVKSHKPMRTLAKSPAASGRTLVSEPADDGISASEVGARPFARRSRRSAVRRQATAVVASNVLSRVLGHRVIAAGNRLSKFRGLPQSATVPLPNCLDGIVTFGQ